MKMANQQIIPTRTQKPVSQSRFIGRVSQIRELGLLAVLLLLILIVGIQAPRFLHVNNLVQILLSISILAIVAVGETLVILTRNVDLSVGSMVGISAFITADLFKQIPGMPLLSAILLGCVIGLLLGIINGLIITCGRVPSIVATLGTLYVYRGLSFIIAGHTSLQVNAADVPASYLALATTPILGIPALIIFALVIAVIAGYLLHATRTGRQLYAIGSNPDAADIIGIRRNLLTFGVFALSGLLCGFAGVLWGARYATVDATAATSFELQVIAAVVVGGVNIFGGSGTILGAMLGAIVLGTLDNALSILNISQFWLQAFDGGAILFAIALDAFIMRRLKSKLLTRREA
jgi:rhamnose transport system permease protein